MSGLSIVCVWCKKPLVDAEHAKKHVAEQCDKAPWRTALTEAARLLVHMRPEYCKVTCSASGNAHEATCAEAREWLAAHPFVRKE